MKIKLDENIAGSKDTTVWESAQREARFLITQDLDFSDIRIFRPGTHHGILLVRLRSPGRLALLNKISELFLKENTDEWRGCFLVLTDVKLRIHRAGVQKPEDM